MGIVKLQLPRVSVCIPTYRGRATIGPAIESVLAQSLTDFELIVIDDSSPDDTRAIVEGFADPRPIYVRNEHNLGPQGNWNRCLELARGKYFKLLPHDDRLHPHCLERQVAVLDTDRDERIALVFSARDVLGPEGRVITRRGYPGGREGPIAGGMVIRACVRRGTNLLGEPGAVLFRRQNRGLRCDEPLRHRPRKAVAITGLQSNLAGYRSSREMQGACAFVDPDWRDLLGDAHNRSRISGSLYFLNSVIFMPSTVAELS